MKTKGFTLIELLAVIVILGIITTLVIPSVFSVIRKGRENAYNIIVDSIEESARVYATRHREEMEATFEEFNYVIITLNDLKNDNLLKDLIDPRTDESIPLSKKVIIARETDKTLSICYEDGNCNWSIEGVNKPKLATGMIPVKWVTDHWVTTTKYDADWYQYGKTPSTRNWANVIQVNAGVRASYETVGKTVDVENDVIAMWVWIPRYIYNISDGWHQKMTETTGGTIEVKFSMGTDDTRGGTVTLTNTGNASDSNNKWTSHPAFKFGDDQLTGIWVAKFEASNDGNYNINIKPNVSSWGNIAVSDMFDTTRSMEMNDRYGWDTSGANRDTHLMKNIEWGAVAYLAHSTYGINGDIGINNNGSYLSGCGAAAGSSESPTCNTYDTTGMVASTTGNIYGVYDMSGGAWEQVAGYIDNSYADDYGESLVNANDKYKDVYTTSTADIEEDLDNAYLDNYALSVGHKGDAVYETSHLTSYYHGWYYDTTYMPSVEDSWFLRGENHYNSSSAGIFSFHSLNGDNHGGRFRPVVLVGAGL